MPLEPRLQTAAEYIRALTHADIGSDHALLPRYLLQSGQVERVIVVEKTMGPAENARRALKGLNAEVRMGNGLGPLGVGEVDSLSITGMGARRMVKILSAQPEKLPAQLVLQPNDSAEPLRGWARENGFHLCEEELVEGFWYFTVLNLKRQSGPDPAYKGVPLMAALRYGPLLIKRKRPLLIRQLKQTQLHLAKQVRRRDTEVWQSEFKMVEQVLKLLR